MAYFAQFCALAHFLPDYRTVLLPIPLEEMPRPLPHFDTVFSMGVIYHRSSPIDHLLQLKDCLCDGGELVLETIVVDGPAGYTLMPQDHTLACLMSGSSPLSRVCRNGSSAAAS